MQAEGGSKDKESQLNDLHTQLNMIQQQYQQESENNDELKGTLRDKQAQLEQQARTIENKWVYVFFLKFRTSQAETTVYKVSVRFSNLSLSGNFCWI